MIETGGAAADDDTTDRSVADPAAAAAAIRTPSGPVRDRVFDWASEAGRDHPAAEAAALDGFLEEPDAGRALIKWFGAGSQWLRRPLSRRRLLHALDRDIAALDRALSAQVNAILHEPRFQRLEASWRGLVYLVTESETDERIWLRVLSLGWTELCRDLERAMEFDQSQLFAKVYSEEFGMPGGVPFGVLIGDYEVQHRRTPGHPTDDVAALKALSHVAAAAFAPIMLGCSPIMLGVDNFAGLGVPVDLTGTFRHVDYARWNSFQDSEDARFVGLVLPRVLMREPHRDVSHRIDRFRFHEEAAARDVDRYLWGTAVYAFAGVLIRAFSQFGWFADIRGAPRDRLAGGMVTNLPVACFATDRIGVVPRYSTDVAVSERQEMELSGLGFVPLSHCHDTPFSAFFANQSAQRAKRYDRPAATINAQLSAMLQYILCVSRFSHYIKVIGRDRVGALGTPGEVQSMLSRWLQRYITANENAPAEEKARYPLSEASVQVREVEGRPGNYHCTIHLKPHFQLDQVVSSFKLVTELASPHGQ